MDRRAFLSWVGVGWLASCLPVALVACVSERKVVPASDRPDGFHEIGAIADLDRAGHLLEEKFAINPILVIRDPANSKNLIAVNPTCTHQGCLVNWQNQKKLFVCPCHAAVFDPNGKVIQAPATKPLATYPVKVEGKTILVKLS